MKRTDRGELAAFRQLRLFLNITQTHGIARRYFVVNGFDGALAMLGLILGFLVTSPTDLAVVINACLGVAIALSVSGVSSAFISEMAESKRSLDELEQAMIADLDDTAQGAAARRIPLVIALINGAAPLLISLLIIAPLWLAGRGMPMPMSPLYSAVLVCLILIFLLGIFLGRIAGISWLRSGVQTLLVALVTAVLIFLFAS